MQKMRAGLSTIQQTLTTEAATVLNHSIAEAGRRNHGQTTPLHVAATLLASPSGFLRQACIRAHPNSSHPLQCRALELCFSVALERLPTAQNVSPGAEPPISNALMAALKRAQAHQRRGCPEQQQQPLLAVKVELEQLVISILDDPSVSRVMREASFSSPAVKATIEQSLNSTTGNLNPSTVGIGFRPNPSLAPIRMPILNKNLYLNPRLQQGNLAQAGNQRNEEVKKVIDILLRNTRKRNPVLVGELEPEAVVKEALRRIEKGEFDEGPLKNVLVIQIEKELDCEKAQILDKLQELGGLIEGRTGDSNGIGVILDMGDLKWLVDQPIGNGVPGLLGVACHVVSETGGAAVTEMAKLLARFRESTGGRFWLVGTATCETYLRCQVYHPSMENDWDLQAVPVASRTPLPGIFPRIGTNEISSSSVDSLNPLKRFPTATNSTPRHLSENLDPARIVTCCPQCKENYEQELAKLVAMEFENSSSERKNEAVQPVLPQWLQNAKALDSGTKIPDQSQARDQDLLFKQKSEELQKKWNDMCLQLHPSHHRSLGPQQITPTALSMTGLGLYNPKLLAYQDFQPKLGQTRNLRDSRQLNSHQIPSQLFQPKSQQTRTLGDSLESQHNQAASQPSESAISPPHSPVQTDLVLGPAKLAENRPQKINDEPVIKDLLGCISSEPQNKLNQLLNDKFSDALDADSFKKLLKGLMEKVWWQPEAASVVATTFTQCKLGHGKLRAAGYIGNNNTWLLFTGPDRVGKKKMASVLSAHVFGTSPVMICLGSRHDNEEFDLGFRGKTVLDRIAEAVRRNPFSVIMLEDIDEADMLVRGSIRRGMERGRLTDSHGREISLGNVIFILTGNWSNQNILDENKFASFASCGWQLRLTVGEKRAKRRANWLQEIDRQKRARKELGSGLSLDLNQEAGAEDDRTDGSNNSSDLTNDHEEEFGLDNRQFAITSVPHELVNSVDAAIVFKPANFELIRCEIEKTITKTCVNVLDEKLSVEIEDEAIRKIVGGLWFGRTSLQEWAETVLVPTLHQLKSQLTSSLHYSLEETMVVRIESDTSSDTGNDKDWLPSKITVMIDGV